MTGTPVHYTPVMEFVLSPPRAPTEGDTDGPGCGYCEVCIAGGGDAVGDAFFGPR